MTSHQKNVEKSSKSNDRLTIVEDEYGNIIVRPDGKCPPGYVTRIKKSIRERGLIFPYVDDD